MTNNGKTNSSRREGQDKRGVWVTHQDGVVVTIENSAEEALWFAVENGLKVDRVPFGVPVTEAVQVKLGRRSRRTTRQAVEPAPTGDLAEVLS